MLTCQPSNVGSDKRDGWTGDRAPHPYPHEKRLAKVCRHGGYGKEEEKTTNEVSLLISPPDTNPVSILYTLAIWEGNFSREQKEDE